MKKTLMAAACSLILLSGCASNDYKLYAETQQRIAQSEAQKETARYQALAEIAKQGDTAAKVAAVMSIQFNGGGGNSPKQQVAAPVSSSETALRWAGVLLPTFGQFYTISQHSKVAIAQSNNSTALGMRQSDNQTAVAQNTNATFATMNGNMATSNTTIANAGFAAVTNVANTGIAQVGTTAAAGLTAVTTVNANSNTAITNVANAANASIQAIADVIPQLQPTVTTTTTTNNTTSP